MRGWGEYLDGVVRVKLFQAVTYNLRLVGGGLVI